MPFCPSLQLRPAIVAIALGGLVWGNAAAQNSTAADQRIELMGSPATAAVSAAIRRLPMQEDVPLPNDPLSDQQWSFMSSEVYRGAADIFNVQHNAQRAATIVAVVDSGLRLDHEDYFTLPGYDFIKDPAVANDGDGRDADASDPGDWVSEEDLRGELNDTCKLTQSKWHGTAIAGVIGAQTANNIGIAGAARDVQLLPVRVTGKCGGYVSDLIDGIRWSAGLPVAGVPDNLTPARVINLSVGFAGTCSVALQQAIDDAVKAGAILVTAATNYGVNLDESPHAPASCANVLTIGANLRDGSLAPYSSVGSQVFLMGPGGNSHDGIISTDNNGRQSPDIDSSYGYHYGTSLAAAHVSATLATLLSVSPQLTNAQLGAALQDAAIPTTERDCAGGLCGAGLLNTQRSVQLLIDGELPVVDTAAQPPVAAATSSSKDAFAGSTGITLAILLLLRLPYRRRATGHV
ncbi:MAG: S8 family peptidase [Pseudomonadota bacterium]